MSVAVPPDLAQRLGDLSTQLADLIDRASAEDLEDVVAALGVAEMRAKARYLTSAIASTAAAAASEDRVVGVVEAAARLGVSPDWIYRRSKRLPFVVRIGGKLGCSSRGIERFIQQGLSSKKRLDM